MPVDTCGVVYGSQNWHFLTYGFISPSEYNCLIQVRLSFIQSLSLSFSLSLSSITQ